MSIQIQLIDFRGQSSGNDVADSVCARPLLIIRQNVGVSVIGNRHQMSRLVSLAARTNNSNVPQRSSQPSMSGLELFAADASDYKWILSVQQRESSVGRKT